ncbi:MAG TPA: hypothetical protein VNR40_15235, partial [Steroidobacter sp.]|nr:hypothetical protein [Steroidobacter sp.]
MSRVIKTQRRTPFYLYRPYKAAAMPTDLSTQRKWIAGRSIRWNDERASQAYARGQWVRETLADALQKAAEQTPQRILLIDAE